MSPANPNSNVAGILAMLAAMACFVANDACLKLASPALPLGEMIFLRNTVATALVVVLILARGDMIAPGALPSRFLGLRVAGEVLGTTIYLTALMMMPIADVTAIIQFAPLALTAAAAVFLRETVGWRRWAAAAAGFFGVLLIVRPGSPAFGAAALLAFAAMLFMVLRDFATRQIPSVVPTLFIVAVSSAALMLAGLSFAIFETWVWPTAEAAALTAAAGLILALGYALIVIAFRSGDLAVVAPFQYSVMIYAIAAGLAIWGEMPDSISLFGIAIVMGAGVYAFQRENLRGRAALQGR